MKLCTITYWYNHSILLHHYSCTMRAEILQQKHARRSVDRDKNEIEMYCCTKSWCIHIGAWCNVSCSTPKTMFNFIFQSESAASKSRRRASRTSFAFPGDHGPSCHQHVCVDNDTQTQWNSHSVVSSCDDCKMRFRLNEAHEFCKVGMIQSRLFIELPNAWLLFV